MIGISPNGKCYGCKYLRYNTNVSGICTCQYGRLQSKQRFETDRACKHKNKDYGEMVYNVKGKKRI